MCRWRKRIGDAGAEQLLQETIAARLKLKAVKAFHLKWVKVDTTVQEKEIRFPTDARFDPFLTVKNVRKSIARIFLDGRKNALLPRERLFRVTFNKNVKTNI
jgi:IS5 family transposase